MANLRIDKQLEANQTRRALEKRFKDLFWAFHSDEYENPVTKASLLDALINIRNALSKALC
jgi:hypothetical protein